MDHWLCLFLENGKILEFFFEDAENRYCRVFTLDLLHVEVFFRGEYRKDIAVFCLIDPKFMAIRQYFK